MLILTIEQMQHASWEHRIQGGTLFDGLAIHAGLQAEGLAQCALGNHCDDMRGACVFCAAPTPTN